MARRLELEDAESFFNDEPTTATAKPVGRRATVKKPAAAKKTVKPKVKTVKTTSVAKKKEELARRIRDKAAKPISQIKTSEISEKPKTETATPKKRGRPRKTETKETPKMAVAKKRPGRPSKATTEHKEEVKKKRPGRPRKVAAEHKEPSKKRVGRPRKVAEHKEEHKKPGRPRKVGRPSKKEVKHDREETKLRHRKTTRKAAVEKAKTKARITKDGKIDMRGKYVRTAEHRRKISKAMKESHRRRGHNVGGKKPVGKKRVGRPAKHTVGTGKGHYKRSSKHGLAISNGRMERKAIVSKGRPKAYDITTRLPMTEKNMPTIKKARKAAEKARAEKPVAKKRGRPAKRHEEKPVAKKRVGRPAKKAEVKKAGAGKGHYKRSAKHGEAISRGREERKLTVSKGRAKLYDIKTRLPFTEKNLPAIKKARRAK